MIVVKLGGSLSESPLLREWLVCARDLRGKKTVIVPGGGHFAELVRMAQKQWHFSDRTAHNMALLAMQQMAMLFQGIIPELAIAGTDKDINRVLQKQHAVIWSPDLNWLEQSGIAASWSITSDSLSAWLAAILHAESLVLVKSAQLAKQYSCQELVDNHIVDKAFGQYTSGAQFDIKFFNKNDIMSFKAGFI